MKGDVRTAIHNRSWEHFRSLQQGFKNTGVKLSYYDEAIEILMPGKAHELFKKIIAILIELTADTYRKVERSMIPAFAKLDMQVMSQCILIGETSMLKAIDKLLKDI